MTEQARRDAMGVTTQAAANRFYQEYGSVFVTRFTLGGYLYSTRSVTSIETASLDQVKDKTRIAAGLSVQTEYASGGIQFAKVNSTSTTNTAGSLLQDSCLTWDAVGGDTLLCTKSVHLGPFDICQTLGLEVQWLTEFALGTAPLCGRTRSRTTVSGG